MGLHGQRRSRSHWRSGTCVPDCRARRCSRWSRSTHSSRSCLTWRRLSSISLIHEDQCERGRAVGRRAALACACPLMRGLLLVGVRRRWRALGRAQARPARPRAGWRFISGLLRSCAGGIRTRDLELMRLARTASPLPRGELGRAARGLALTASSGSAHLSISQPGDRRTGAPGATSVPLASPRTCCQSHSPALRPWITYQCPTWRGVGARCSHVSENCADQRDLLGRYQFDTHVRTFLS